MVSHTPSLPIRKLITSGLDVSVSQVPCMHQHQFSVSIIGDLSCLKIKKCIQRIVEWSDFPQLHLSSSYFGRRIIKGLQYIGARAPLYWSPLTTIFRNIILWLIENHFLSWINPIQMDWVLLNLIGVIAKKYFWFTSLLCKKHIWWAPIYWSLGSIILEPRLHYIGAPSVQQTCFLFYFWTWNTANKRFPVH